MTTEIMSQKLLEDYYPYLELEPYVHFYDSLTFELDSTDFYRLVPVSLSDTTYESVRIIVKSDTLSLQVDSLKVKADSLKVKDDSLKVKPDTFPVKVDSLPVKIPINPRTRRVKPDSRDVMPIEPDERTEALKRTMHPITIQK